MSHIGFLFTNFLGIYGYSLPTVLQSTRFLPARADSCPQPTPAPSFKIFCTTYAKSHSIIQTNIQQKPLTIPIKCSKYKYKDMLWT